MPYVFDVFLGVIITQMTGKGIGKSVATLLFYANRHTNVARCSPNGHLIWPCVFTRYLSSQSGNPSGTSQTSNAQVSFDKAGAVLLTLPLNDGQPRRFVINNDSATTLATLADDIRREGVTTDIVFQSATDGVCLAHQSTKAWQALSWQPTQILFNGKTINVDIIGQPPASGTGDTLQSLFKVEGDLAKRAESLRRELEPLDAKAEAMLATSHRRTRVLTWVGLAYMATQFGFLARLTWWDYSWDIVEPITYFVTYGTGLFFYSYYVVTRQEANFAAMFDRQQLITVHKRIAKSQFDLSKYNKLREDLNAAETQLANLHRSAEWQVLNKTTQAVS